MTSASGSGPYQRFPWCLRTPVTTPPRSLVTGGINHAGALRPATPFYPDGWWGYLKGNGGDRCVPAEAVSRAPALRFVALLFAVSVDCRLIDDGGKGASIVSSNKEEEMPNPGQPLIRRGDQGTAVFRAQRALRRTPDLSVALDADFGPDTEAAVERFQEGAGLDVDGIVGDDTWAALPNGGPMPLLKAGSKGDVVRGLQEVLISGSEDGDW